MAEQSNGYGKGYGKRPLWQWVVIYLVIAAVVYGAVYYFYMKKSGKNYGTNTSGTSGTGTTTTTNSLY